MSVAGHTPSRTTPGCPHARRQSAAAPARAAAPERGALRPFLQGVDGRTDCWRAPARACVAMAGTCMPTTIITNNGRSPLFVLPARPWPRPTDWAAPRRAGGRGAGPRRFGAPKGPIWAPEAPKRGLAGGPERRSAPRAGGPPLKAVWEGTPYTIHTPRARVHE
eukprot:scaffold5732_cov369-Prasinococcus_capsulatus_cf.AAC.5